MWFKRDESLRQELEDYIERETAENIAQGMSAENARAAARRKLGNPALIHEDTRAVWGWLWLERLWQDVVHATRMFAKNPGFTTIAILSIALGTGANVGAFSGADALFLRPLSIARPDDLYTLGAKQTTAGFTRLTASYPDFQDLREHNRSFSKLCAFTDLDLGLAIKVGDQPKIKYGTLVSDDFFNVIGVPAMLGRTFRPGEDQVPNRDAVIVLSYELWSSDFARDPDIVGRQLWVNNIPFTVVGVAAESFTGMDIIARSAFWVPLAMWPRLANSAESPLESRGWRSLMMRGRLKDGVSVAAAQTDIATIGESLRATYPATNRDTKFEAQTEYEARITEHPGNAGQSLMALVLSVTVLLIACANLAGLLASRAPIRAREVALRLAVGANRSRLIRQIVTENLMIAAIGSLLGLIAGAWIVGRLQAIPFPTDFSMGLDIRMDRRALLFSMIAAIASVFVFGLMPAVETVRINLTSALKIASSDSGRRRTWGRNALVITQVALALMMLTISVTLYQSFSHEYGAGPGFRTDHLYLMSMNPWLVNRSPEDAQQFYTTLLDRARDLPGVESASLTTKVPLSMTGADVLDLAPEGYNFQSAQTYFAARVDEDYFKTMAIPIIRGRSFRKEDNSHSPLVAIVNRAFADRYWPDQNPVGKRFHRDTVDGPWVEIVGVTPTNKYLWVGEPPIDYVYLPMRQDAEPRMSLAVQTKGDPASVEHPLRVVIHDLDPEVPVFDARTMESLYNARVIVAGGTANQMVALMGIIGTALSMIGLYGLVSYSVARRIREFAIRLAVGASPQSIHRSVLSQGARLAAIGIVIGLGLSFIARKGTEAAVPVTGSVGPTTYFVVAVALGFVIVLAASIPARRASQVDPNVALRQE